MGEKRTGNVPAQYGKALLTSDTLLTYPLKEENLFFKAGILKNPNSVERKIPPELNNREAK